MVNTLPGPFEPFPSLAQWAKGQHDTSWQSRFEEHRYAVDYHLAAASQAATDCSASLRKYEWGLEPGSDPQWIRVWNLKPYQLGWYGDTAIREAVSAIDTSLHLISHLFALGTDVRAVRWGGKSEMRKRIRHLPSEPMRSRLQQMLDATINVSLGYDFLSEYRNWATHRGAPRVTAMPSFTGRFPFPVEALKPPTEGLTEWERAHVAELHLKHMVGPMYLDIQIPKQFEVHCWPFTPSGRRDYQSIQPDDPWFKILVEQIPVPLTDRKCTIAGEKLAVYEASTYQGLVTSLVWFVQRTLMIQRDSELLEMCRSSA